MLPADIQEQIELMLTEHPRTILKQRAEEFQTEYRQAKIGKKDPIIDTYAALAYACVRMPNTYQVASYVCDEWQKRAVDIDIHDVLDIGTGTGAVLHNIYARYPNIHMTALEPNPFMRDLASKFLSNDAHITWQASNFNHHKDDKSYDLVTAGYVLNEMTGDLSAAIHRLWTFTKKYLILIETGTPKGFEIISKARDIVLANNGHILAPCPHQYACPLVDKAETRWCHFEQRVARTKIHKDLKNDATRGYEDEPFIYLIASRGKPQNNISGDRLISRVHGTKILSADICTQDGEYKRLQMSRRDHLYPILRRAEWGDFMARDPL